MFYHRKKYLARVTLFAVIAVIIPVNVLAQETLPSIPTIQATKPIAAPVRLIIPKIGVNAGVEALGRRSNGVLALPRNYNNIGWYQQSARPGKPGNALMWGHLDGAHGPAVLWNLKKMKVGDTLKIKDQNGNTIVFRVWKKQSYLYTRAPMAELLGKAKTSRLNIVTCDGVWNRSTRNYSHRLIIFTEIIR